jgi:hypothetical protein
MIVKVLAGLSPGGVKSADVSIDVETQRASSVASAAAMRSACER